MTTPETTVERFNYPTGSGPLRSVEEFRQAFLPAYYELDAHGMRVKRTVELLLRHAPDGKRRMLDYGCGAGTFSHQIARRRPGWTIEGWEGDYSAHAVAEECFALDNLSFLRKSYGAYAELTEPRFDVISFLEVLEHVDDPGAILSGFHRGLHDGGLLLLSTPNFMGYREVSTELRRIARTIARKTTRAGIVRELNDRPYDVTSQEGHVSLYSLVTLTNLLRVEGFELIEFDVVPQSEKLLHRLFPETLVVLARKTERR
jgi:2-polyprenyl-3-methyl-5-hydroxy-6-metoxy-1,4-benzoquinol methylase